MNLRWIILLSSMTMGLYGQNWTVQTTLDKDTILIGEEVTVTFNVEGPSNSAFQFVEPLDTTGTIAWLSSSEIPESTNELGKASFEGVFSVYDSGTAVLNFRCILVDQDTLMGNNHFLTILLVEPIEGKDIGNPSDTWKEERWWWIWIIVAIVILGLIYYFVKVRKPINHQEEQPSSPQEDPIITALNRLRALEQGGMNNPKVFYTELSDIIRFCIEKVLHERAEELTTDEILNTLRDGYPKVVAAIGPVLRESDLVKFAKFNPDKLQASRSIERTQEALQTIKSLHHVEQ